jgi:hypothetical protein
MKTYNKKDKYDVKEALKIGAEDWQLELLKLNPEYVFWGIGEDYMRAEGSGWDSAIIHKEWGEHAPIGLDDLNEVVNFYFEICRESKECPSCEGECYHEKARDIARSWYQYQCRLGEISWSRSLTKDEIKALVKARRLSDLTHEFIEGKGWVEKTPKKLPTLEEVNEWARKGIGHDAINRCICIEARLKRLGLPQWCEECEGDGRVYIEPKPHVNIVLWLIHPRKGASRGVQIRITQNDLPKVFEFLKEASKRNVNRFKKVCKK